MFLKIRSIATFGLKKMYYVRFRLFTSLHANALFCESSFKAPVHLNWHMQYLHNFVIIRTKVYSKKYSELRFRVTYNYGTIKEQKLLAYTFYMEDIAKHVCVNSSLNECN